MRPRKLSLCGFCLMWPESRAGPESLHPDCPGAVPAKSSFGQTAPFVVHSLSCARLFATPWTAASQESLFFTISWSSLRLMSFESVMPSNHLMLCHPQFLLPSIFLSIRVFSNESALHIRWPKFRSFSIGPSNESSGLISFRLTGLISLKPFKRPQNT